MSDKIKVLLVGSRPKELAPLSVKEQMMRMLSGTARYGNAIDLIDNLSTEFIELPGLLVKHRPNILHVVAHGSEQGLLAFENAQGQTDPIEIARFKKVLAACSSTIKLRCVILNSCYMGELANSLTEIVEFVIASPSKLMDKIGSKFFEVFYQMLSLGESIESAFAAAMATLSGDDESYKLYRRHSMSDGRLLQDKPKLDRRPLQNQQPSWDEHSEPRLHREPEALRSGQVSKLLYELLRSAATFDAFCLDSFTDVYNRFSSGMDREEKHTLLLKEHRLEEVLKALSDYYPKEYARIAPSFLGDTVKPHIERRPTYPFIDNSEKRDSLKKPSAKIRMACFCAEQDADAADELRRHLSPLLRQPQVSYWDMSLFESGRPKGPQLEEQLNTAQVLLFLVSADLLADPNADRWIHHAMWRSRRDPDCLVVPISWRHALLSQSPLGELVVLPAGSLPVSQWRSRDEAWRTVCDKLRQLLEKLLR